MLGADPFLVAYYTWRTTQGTELKAIIIYKAQYVRFIMEFSKVKE